MAATRPGTAGKRAPAPSAATPASEPAPQPAPPPPAFLQPPRATTDDPWRDLHPAIVWPD
jgi:hypothetical protein